MVRSLLLVLVGAFLGAAVSAVAGEPAVTCPAGCVPAMTPEERAAMEATKATVDAAKAAVQAAQPPAR